MYLCVLYVTVYAVIDVTVCVCVSVSIYKHARECIFKVSQFLYLYLISTKFIFENMQF